MGKNFPSPESNSLINPAPQTHQCKRGDLLHHAARISDKLKFQTNSRRASLRHRLKDQPVRLLLFQIGMPDYLRVRVAAIARLPGVKVTVATLTTGQVGRKDDGQREELEKLGVEWVSLSEGLFEDAKPLRVIPRAFQLIARVNPDAIYTAGMMPMHHAAILLFARARRIGTIVFSENTLDEPRRTSFLTERIKRFIMRQVSTWVVPSERAAERLLAYGISPQRIVNCGHPVDHERWREAARELRTLGDDALKKKLSERGLPSQPYLLYVGRFISRKNLHRCLDAYAHAKRKGAKLAPMVLVGDTSGRQAQAHAEMLDKAGELGIAGDITFAGYMGAEELKLTYVGARALFLISEWEPWGLVVNEAFACGTPAILSHTAGSAPELIDPKRTGWLAYPLSITSIAEAFTQASAMEGISSAGLEENLWYICQQNSPQRHAQAMVEAAKLARSRYA